MKRLAIFVLMVVVLGCHTPTQREKDQALAKQLEMDETIRRLRYIEAHPELSSVVKKAIYHGEVAAGMTESDVRASIGEPDQISTTDTDHGSLEQWYYKTGSRGKDYLNFDDGTLTSWQPTH